jgi:hypothetical protein
MKAEIAGPGIQLSSYHLLVTWASLLFFRPSSCPQAVAFLACLVTKHLKLQHVPGRHTAVALY